MSSVLVTSRTSSRLVLSSIGRERRETNVHGSAGVRSGSRLEPFLLVPIPASHARLLGIYMGLLASRGVKHSECLGIDSSDDQSRSSTKPELNLPPSCALQLSPWG